MKSTDTNYKTDYDQMEILRILNIGDSYWLASRYAATYAFYSGFYVRYVDSNGSLIDYNFLCSIEADSAWGNKISNGLRPIFILNSNVKVIGGSGTSDSPYTLGV